MNELKANGPLRTSLLIVDDNPQNLQVLGKMLQDNNYNIEFAINGPAALDWLANRRFDLILLDINMPGMNGFEVCAKIRSDPELNNVAVIFLSADNDRASILKGFELGAQDYIIKPFDSRELLVRVKTHLSLKYSLESLEELNRSLEEKVKERTFQLQEANKQLERLNLKLVDLDKIKSEFLNIISHEIRTPLNGIIGPMEMLKEKTGPEDVKLLLGILDTSVKRLEHFALDALLITRLSTRPGEIKKEKIDMPAMLEGLLKSDQERIDSKNIRISFKNELKDNVITGESMLVSKMLYNILDNAIFFTRGNGAIGVRLYSEGSHVVSEFSDSGPGFSSDSKEKYLELFTVGEEFRDNSSGLGLPISKMIAEAHGGRITVGNKPGGGAVVRLYISRDQL